MPDIPTLCAAARIPLPDPLGMLGRMCAHFQEHGTVRIENHQGWIESQFGKAFLVAESGALTMRAECPDRVALSVVKATLSEHLATFAGDALPPFSWSGDGADERALPYFHEMRVVGSRSITPRMRRVTLSGDVSRLEKGGLHVRVLIPPPDRTPIWPVTGPDGRILWPTGDDALTARIYTIRSIDRKMGRIDVDVMLHGKDKTPGSAWATRALPGERVGLLGPGGGELPDADTYLFLGDETALPAVARMLATLPAGKRTVVFLEVADCREEQPLPSLARCEITWLHRDRSNARQEALLDTLKAFDWGGAGNDRVFVFAGCEHDTARALRRYLRKERAMANDTHQIAGYWRLGS